MSTTLSEKMQKKFHKTIYVSDLKDMLFKSAKKYANRPAFKLKDSIGNIYSVTYTKFKNDIINLGTSLINLGFENKKIAVIGKNSYNWAVSYMAASIVGVVVPIDKELHCNEVINFLNISESSCILGDNKYITSILEHRQSLKNENITFINFNSDKSHNDFISYFSLLEKGEILVEEGDKSFENIKINPDDMHILLFTSGTTGNAKGVCLSHKNICSNIQSVYGIVKVKPSDQVLSILPIHHTYECTLGFLLLIYSGGCVAFCDGLRHITENFLEYKPTVVLSVPLLLEKVYNKIENQIKSQLPQYAKNKDFINSIPFPILQIVKYKVHKSLGGNIRAFIVGAAPLNPNLICAFNKLGLTTLQGYGLTECSPLVAGNNDFYSNPNAVGLPIPNVEYKINEPDENGNGEILVKGPNVMLGYYNNPEETNKVLKDGWFFTGDLGRIDNQGWLYVTGRKKTVIVTKNGKNIYPEELEQLLSNTDYVKDCLVYGIKNSKTNDVIVHCQILPDIDAIEKNLGVKNPSIKELKKIFKNNINYVNSLIPNYKHIKSYDIQQEEFEKTTTQKIKRYGNNVGTNK